MSQSLFSIAFGVGTRNREEQWLEVLFPRPLLQPSAVFVKRIKAILATPVVIKSSTLTLRRPLI